MTHTYWIHRHCPLWRIGWWRFDFTRYLANGKPNGNWQLGIGPFYMMRVWKP